MSTDSYSFPWRLVQNKIVRYPGGREIDRFRGVEPAADDGRPEAWIGSDTRTIAASKTADPNDGCSECLLPDGSRRYLFEVIDADPEKALGARHIAANGARVGFLVKLLDAQRQLLLQSHPTRAYAKAHFGSDYGKEESWYIIGKRGDTAEPPYVLMGFKEGVTRERFEAGYDAQDVDALESCCHKVPIEIGDAFFIQAGTPHAVGPGCFLVEVQEPSDITVGWKKLASGTPEEQEAHKQRLLGCYIYNGADEAENLRRYRIPPRTVREGAWGREQLIIGQGQTDFFSFTRLEARDAVELIRTGFPQIAVVLGGTGAMVCGGASLPLARGDEFFIPCAAGPVTLQPEPRADAAGGAGEPLTLVLCNPAGVSYTVI